MATWEVTPSEGVVNNNNGTFTFPENSGSTDIVYTINYKDDDGCHASTLYTISAGTECQPTPVECKCADITLSNNSITFEWNSTIENQQTVSVNMPEFCNTNVSITKEGNFPNWFNAEYFNGVIRIWPKQQNSNTTIEKTAIIKVSFDINDDCTKTINVKHKPQYADSVRTVRCNFCEPSGQENCEDYTLIITCGYLKPKESRYSYGDIEPVKLSDSDYTVNPDTDTVLFCNQSLTRRQLELWLSGINQSEYVHIKNNDPNAGTDYFVYVIYNGECNGRYTRMQSWADNWDNGSPLIVDYP